MYLGLDLGTSGLKALLLDEQQRVVYMATAALEVSRPQTGWSEQNPRDWIAACIQVMTDLKEHLPKVQGIGIAGHMHGVVLIDDAGEPIRPCLLWNDGRSGEQARAMDAIPVFRQISGTIVFPGFSAPKMAWLRDNEPENWARTYKMLLPKDYLAYWLTGELACDPSDAAGSALFDCQQGKWSSRLCQMAGLEIDLLPALIASDRSRGRIRPQVARQLSLAPACLVAGGAGDNAAASVGIGAVRDGQGQVSLGTSGVVLAVNERWTPNAETAVHSFNHAVQGSFIQMGVTLTATDSLTWLSDLLGQPVGALAHSLPEKSDGPGDLLYLPYLAGERTPHNLSYSMGNFFGLNRQHGARNLTQAVMEGVVYSLADCASALTAAGASLESLTAVGGGARSPFWLQTLADVLERPLTLNPRAEHAAALGGAKLAMAAVLEQPVQDIVEAEPKLEMDSFHIVQPRCEHFEAYRGSLKRYRNLFTALREI